MRIAVGIATRGRSSILADTIADLETQLRPPDSVLVAYADPADIGDAASRFPHVRFLRSELGLTRQRNAILDGLQDEEIVTFLDDDFYLDPSYFAVMERVFCEHPEVVVATGKLLGDGINGPGLSLAEARRMLNAKTRLAETGQIAAAFNAYGCNMAIRMHPVREHRLRFDEDLPLYGWYEDVDFSRRLAPYGEIVRVEDACGVHLGAKSGRQSGVRLGYSQVANPFYLARKRSVSWSYAIASMTSRSLKNLVRSASPEPFVDRRGRLRGNLRAWQELLSGSISPTRILSM